MLCCRRSGLLRTLPKILHRVLSHWTTRVIDFVMVASIYASSPASNGHSGRRSRPSLVEITQRGVSAWCGSRSALWLFLFLFGSPAFEFGPCSQLVLEDVPAVVLASLHDDKFAVVYVPEVLKVLDRPVIPEASQYVAFFLPRKLGPHHFMRNTLDISPCVTNTHTLGKLSSPNDLHRLSLKPLTRS